MKYLGLGLWLKSDVCFADILAVCALIREAQGKSFWLRFVHYKRVIEIMTTGRKVRWFHFFLIHRVLDRAGMLSEKKVEYDPEAKIMHFANWLAPRLRMSARDILTQYSVHSLDGFYKEALAFNFKKDVSVALAQHAPVKFHEMVEQMYDYRRADALEARNAEIAETENDPDYSPVNMLGNAFDPGGFRG